MSVELHVPKLSEMALRQAWLNDPDTMAYNRGRDLGAEGYHPDTGCIDFSRENWRWWRQVWLFNEPDFYTAYIRDTDSGSDVGEVCWFRDGDAYTAGILIEARHRGRGLCAPALRVLMDHAFRRDDVPALQCALSPDDLPAVRGYLRAGFHSYGVKNGMNLLIVTKEDWERTL